MDNGRSPCFNCSRLDEDKFSCAKGCEVLKEFQQGLWEKPLIQGINYTHDMFQEPENADGECGR